MKQNYQEYVTKFNKHTSDDTFTPPEVYEVVLQYVFEKYGFKKYGINESDVIRPFWPGKDYKKEDYRGKLVVDNPPFSIQTEIYDWYNERGIPFFLFCAGLTPPKRRGLIATGVTILYPENVRISTSFITNLEDIEARSDPELYRRIKDVQPGRTLKKKERNGIITVADLNGLSRQGETLVIDKTFKIVRKFDDGSQIFAYGWRKDET